MLSEIQQSNLKKMLIKQQKKMDKMSMDENTDISPFGSLRDSTDELSTIDNHPADLATELYDREKDMALKVHNEDLKSRITEALERMDNGTYGICVTCQKEIPYNRLKAIPYTKFCIEHTEDKYIPSDRPIEEDVLLPPVDNSFANRQAHDSLQDDEDSFQIVAQYGNSDTPADFEGDYDHYNDLYDDREAGDENAAIDDLHISNHEMLHGQISQQYADEARKHDYLE